MSDSITIKEQVQPIYKIGTYVSIVFCIICFIIFWNISSPLWISIFRFSSFIFFALAVLGYLRIRNRPLTMTVKSSDRNLIIFYKKKSNVIQEEEFERSTIKEILAKRSKSTFGGPISFGLRIHFTDTSNRLQLFEFGGRPLFFSTEALDLLSDFLQEHNIPIRREYEN